MGCTPVKLPTPDGEYVNAIVCTGRTRHVRCSVCKRPRSGAFRCDQPDATRKSGTCDKALCGDCRVITGADHDICPSHGREAQGSLL